MLILSPREGEGRGTPIQELAEAESGAGEELHRQPDERVGVGSGGLEELGRCGVVDEARRPHVPHQHDVAGVLRILERLFVVQAPGPSPRAALAAGILTAGMTVSYRYNMRFPGTREQISQACVEAVRQCGFKVRASNLAAGWVEASAGISLRSWGEDIYVQVDREDRVDVTSESRVPFTTNDWGKNKSNVDRIFARLASLLPSDP